MTTPQRVRRRQRILIAIQGITAAIAVVALVLSVSINSRAISRINESRARTLTDTCNLLRAIVFTATPADKQREAARFVNHTPLRNCHAYGARP